METHATKPSELKTWLVIFLAAAVVLVQGVYSLAVVGDRGQPTWEYRPVRDVPGESPYAVYRKLPYPQHIRGREGE